MSERNATTTQHTTVERSAVYDVEGTQFSCMHFEQEEGLRALVHASNVAEQQVLVRLDVDADDMSIVSVNSSPSYGHDGAQRGHLSWKAADQLAIELLGLHAGLVWDDDWLAHVAAR